MTSRRIKLSILALGLAGAATGIGACGKEGIQVAQSDPTYHGAVLFAQHCGGCHTLDIAGTQGGATERTSRERVDGPNFNVRKESVGTVLFALRNGGYSGAIMPQNIVVGAQAMDIARFLAKYSGRQAHPPAGPSQPPAGSGRSPATGG